MNDSKVCLTFEVITKELATSTPDEVATTLLTAYRNGQIENETMVYKGSDWLLIFLDPSHYFPYDPAFRLSVNRITLALEIKECKQPVRNFHWTELIEKVPGKPKKKKE